MPDLCSTPLTIALSGVRRALLLGHKSPDGDCIGSTLGLKHYLLAQGVEEVTIAVVGLIPDNLRWLPGADAIVELTRESDLTMISDTIDRVDMIGLIDFNHIGRIGTPLESLVQAAVERGDKRVVMVDHHPEPDATGVAYLYSDTSCCASAYLLARLLGVADGSLSSSLTADTAQCLLTGIYTDTGLLNHGAITPDLFRTIARLVELGADHDAVVQHVFKSDKLSRQRLLGYIINDKTTYDLEHGIAVFSLRRDEFDRFGIHPSDTEGLVNVPLDVEGIRAVAFLREQGDENSVKISLRSYGHVPVNEVAAHYYTTGGGHFNAAGAEFNGSLTEALDRTWRGLKAIITQDPIEP